MAKFIYIADSHLAASPIGYHQQTAYPEMVPRLAKLLDKWIGDNGDIDFVLNGGDMVDSTMLENIRGAREAFDLGLPVYLCLGNHDMTERNALDLWMSEAPEFFRDRSPNYTIQGDRYRVHVIPNHWDPVPYYWGEIQDAHFLPEQLDQLEKAIASEPDLVHILCTHATVLGVPCEQTGFREPYHAGQEPFSQPILDLARRYPQLRCVLSAHSHINMRVVYNGAHFVTVSGFAETPFEFKVIEIGSEMLAMSTCNLVSRVDFTAGYDYDKTFVQGRAKDRAFEERL